jgi:hypothetical protein
MATSMQATSAPVGALPQVTEICAQRAACATMPAAIGNASRRHGIEKKVPNEATAHPATFTSITNGTEMIRLSRALHRSALGKAGVVRLLKPARIILKSCDCNARHEFVS